MSSDVALPTGPTAPALNLSPSAGTIQLAQWAQELDAAHRLGTALCQTEFVPASFRGKPEAAAAAILAGKSLGLDPMNALANIFIVQGKPALYARTMAALVMAQGHSIVRTQADEKSVTVAGRRKGQEEWQEFTWTIERAQQAGYTSNKKYATDPIAMLTAKAQAEACRTIAPDVLTGLAHSVEEIELEDLGERPAPRPTAASRLIPKDETEPEPEVAGDRASDAQIAALVTAMNALGLETAQQKKAAIADQLGEPKSAKDLTAEEAEILTATFETLAQGVEG
jgi:hypothetical protein